MGRFSSSMGMAVQWGWHRERLPPACWKAALQAGTLRLVEVGATLLKVRSQSVAYSSWKKTTSSFCLMR